jgi:Holliday junction resolvase RusA-like endonuclease
VRGGRAVLVEANKKLPAWRKAVSEAASKALLKSGLDPFTGPVKVNLTFYLARPAKPKWALVPASKPDLDKLIRAVLDGCLPLWSDDCLVVEIDAKKLWASEGLESGCVVLISPL